MNTQNEGGGLLIGGSAVGAPWANTSDRWGAYGQI
jgi:hypothetical protein